MRYLRLICLVGLIGAVSRPVRAQTVDLYVGGLDSLVVLTGDTASAELWVSNIPFSVGVSQYSIDLLLDSSRVRVVSVDSLPGENLPIPTVTWLSSQRVRLSGSGTGTAVTNVRLGVVTFEIDPLAQEGSLVSFAVNSLLDQAGASLLPSHRTDLLDVCQANRLYGDVDVNRVVNSRDALITLTSAVGIAVGAPFEVQWGDVDLDLQVTSRDALFILSAGVGLSVPFGVVVTEPIPNRCAPLEPASADLAFYRGSELHVIDQGDSTPRPVSMDPLAQSSYRVSWAPDGTRVAYTGWTTAGFDYEIIAADRDGSNPDTLTRSASRDFSPAWSPDGTQIAFRSIFRSPSGIYVMDADGGNQVHIAGTDTLTVGNDIAWSPDGAMIAFVAYGSATPGGPFHPWTADLAGQTLQPVPATTIQHAESPSWSSASDSLVFYSSLDAGRLYVMAVPDTAGVPAASLLLVQHYPWWAPNGIAFQSQRLWPYRLYLRRASDGRHFRLTRGSGGNDIRVTMRDPNLVYVDVVSVVPASGTIPAGAPLPLTATVTNSDLTVNATVPLRWISRDPTIATVAPTGTRTADVSGVGTSGQSTWIVVTAGGWRSDSSQVTVQ
jgi:hypothetical protein